MTEQEILSKQGDDLSRALGEVLLAEHEWEASGVYDEWFCPGCRGFQRGSKYRGELKSDYPEVCRIPLTPDNAFKWRDWAVEKFGQGDFYLAMYNVWESTGRLGKFAVWLVSPHCQPEHYILAAVLCETRSKG